MKLYEAAIISYLTLFSGCCANINLVEPNEQQQKRLEKLEDYVKRSLTDKGTKIAEKSPLLLADLDNISKNTLGAYNCGKRYIDEDSLMGTRAIRIILHETAHLIYKKIGYEERNTFRKLYNEIDRRQEIKREIGRRISRYDPTRLMKDEEVFAISIELIFYERYRASERLQNLLERYFEKKKNATYLFRSLTLGK